MRVEVVYALPGEQPLIVLQLEEGATIRRAIEESGLLQRFPELDTASVEAGVFGRVLPPDTRLNPGDRVEIYRPLRADPRQARRDRLEPRGTRAGDRKK